MARPRRKRCSACDGDGMVPVAPHDIDACTHPGCWDFGAFHDCDACEGTGWALDEYLKKRGA